MWRTRAGYALRTVGSSEQAALYAGIDPARTIVLYAGSSKGTDEYADLDALETAIEDGRLAGPHGLGVDGEAVVEGDDHLLKAACDKDGKMIGLDVYRGDADNNLSLDDLSAMLEEKHFAPLKNYHKICEEQRAMGSGGGVPGVIRESTFDMNGVKVHHLAGYIMVDRKLYAICLSTAGVNSNEAHQVWSRVASSVTVKR